MAKSRGISTDIQSPRTKLLYFIYSASNSRKKPDLYCGEAAMANYWKFDNPAFGEVRDF